MKYILMDIEGTTTSISFVHDILFPYSAQRLKNYANSNIENESIKRILFETKKTFVEENKKTCNDEEAIKQLIEWIKVDRKHPALKKIQGMIWNEGYLTGEIKGHLYQDVPSALEKWKKSGYTLGIYSSGSIEAQKDLLSNSIYGNIASLISHNFDTSIGHKREKKSYVNISWELGLPPEEVLFLSDISEELDAAKAAGFKTIQLVRLEEIPDAGHLQVKSFHDISF